MKKYEILEHRADFKIRAFGKTREELFFNALLGMAAGLRPDCQCLPPGGKRRTPPGGKHIRNIKIKSTDLNALLVDFLSEALYLIQTNKEIYDEVKFKKFTDTPSTGSGQAEIEAEFSGYEVERFGEDIKAVTHHDLNIYQKKDKTWEATVLFDI